jgi:hypothetical protein
MRAALPRLHIKHVLSKDANVEQLRDIGRICKGLSLLSTPIPMPASQFRSQRNTLHDEGTQAASTQKAASKKMFILLPSEV